MVRRDVDGRGDGEERWRMVVVVTGRRDGGDRHAERKWNTRIIVGARSAGTEEEEKDAEEKPRATPRQRRTPADPCRLVGL